MEAQIESFIEYCHKGKEAARRAESGRGGTTDGCGAGNESEGASGQSDAGAFVCNRYPGIGADRSEAFGCKFKTVLFVLYGTKPPAYGFVWK